MVRRLPIAANDDQAPIDIRADRLGGRRGGDIRKVIGGSLGRFAGRGSPQSAVTVREAYIDYLLHLRHTYDSHVEIERRFEKDVIPRLGRIPMTQVTRRDIADALQAIVRRGARVAANRTLADVKHFFRYYIERGWLESDPSAAITRRSVGGRECARERVLSPDELRRFIRILLTDRFDIRTRLSFALILLTGQRPSEVLDIDIDEEVKGCWWTIPAERTKPRRKHKVYLAPAARPLLRFARRLGTKPFGMPHQTLDRAITRMQFDPPFTPQDLRRTMSTRLADLGVAPHVVEKMLNHKMEGVLVVYNHAEYLPERRAAWRLWGVYLAKLRREVRAQNVCDS